MSSINYRDHTKRQGFPVPISQPQITLLREMAATVLVLVAIGVALLLLAYM